MNPSRPFTTPPVTVISVIEQPGSNHCAHMVNYWTIRAFHSKGGTREQRRIYGQLCASLARIYEEKSTC